MGINLKTVLSEIINNRYRLLRLANYELKRQNTETMLGFLWNFLNPALQIFVYWFVFAIGLNASAPKGNYPYIIWMIVGIMPWLYISTALMSTMTSIITYSSILKRITFPIAIVPVKSVVSAFLSHLWAMAVVLIVIIISGNTISIYCPQTIYFMLCSLAFLIGYALLVSAITVVFRDFQKIMTSIIRLLFYLSPVVWVQDDLPENLKFALKLNPFAYIIEGYRDSILYGRSLMWHWKQGFYFWCITILLFIVGCNIHMRFRKKFIDLI